MKAKINHLENLNEQQLKAATTTANDVLVLAGAGTGKTRTIIARATHLIYSGTDAERIALLTFTRRAADEMQTRIMTPKLWVRIGIFAGTFHRFCLQIMTKMPATFGIDRYTILDPADQLVLMKSVSLRVTEGPSDLPKPAALIKIFSYARNLGIEPSGYLLRHYSQLDVDSSDIDIIIKIWDEYTEAKEKSRKMDFDDILFRFDQYLRLNVELRNKIKQRYDHILVDEMQDTNPIQWAILEHLRDPVNLFCVGDDAQSIYGFRGADFQNVHSFQERIDGSEVIQLQNNYRSTQEILDVSNWLLKESHLPYDKDLLSERGQGAKPQLHDFENDHLEACWVASDIKKRIENGLELKDCMILTRTARASHQVQAQLKYKNIPYVFIGGMSLFERAHIKNLLAVLKIIVNYKDEAAWFRFLTLWPNLGDKTAAIFYREVLRCTSWEDVTKLLRTLMSHFPEMVSGLMTMKKHESNVHFVVSVAIKMLSVLLEVELEKDPELKDDWKVLLSMAEFEPLLQDFIAVCSIDPKYDPKQKQFCEDQIKLITVHSAKGMESKICYLIQVIPDNYPHRRSDDVEEDRRVLYVALTRAMDELIITRSVSIFGDTPFEDGAHKPISDYLLNQLPSSLVKYSLSFQ